MPTTHRHAQAPGRAPRTLGRWFILAAVAMGAAGYLVMSYWGGRQDPELARRLSHLQRVVWIGLLAPSTSLPPGRLVSAAADAQLDRALAAESPQAWIAQLTARGADGVLVQFDARAQGASVRQRLRRYGHVHGLRGDYLTPGWALYVPDPLQQLPTALADALATVARGIVGGQRAPKVTSFPEPLRRVQNVEVMVLLRRDGRALLWRSARGSSIARALITSAQMARRRWIEREQALGGSIDRLLSRMDVEVALLHEDGELGARDVRFVDAVFGEEHGVAYERGGGWHYSLPEATQRDGDGRASRAYVKLFADNGLAPTSIERRDLRPYRLAVTTLAVSRAIDVDDGDPSRVNKPDDVLGTSAKSVP